MVARAVKAIAIIAVAVLVSALAARAWPVHGQAIQPPAAAAAVGYTSLKFNSSSFSAANIDLGNTKAPGFQWYLSNGWTDSISYTGSNWPTVPTISTSNVVLAGGALTINADPSGFGYGLATAVQNGAGFTGQAFGGGFYVEFVISFTAQTPNSGKVATVWANPTEFLTGNGINTHWAELDLIEAIPIASGDTAQITMMLHDWTKSGSSISSVDCGGGCANINQANPPISHANLGQSHTYATLWLPAAQNGGTGIIKRYFDNQEIVASEQTYSATANPNPCPSNAVCANGQFAIIDSDHFVLFLGADSTIPMTVQSVRVWQLP